jgi:hypothetical protein
MMRVVSFLAGCMDWLRRDLEKEVEYDWGHGFFLILPPVS